MAEVKTLPAFLTRLGDALVDTLKANRIDAEVQFEPIRTTRLYRVCVTAPKFKAMTHSERQSLVWRITERALSSDEQMRISMILTLDGSQGQDD